MNRRTLFAATAALAIAPAPPATADILEIMRATVAEVFAGRRVTVPWHDDRQWYLDIQGGKKRWTMIGEFKVIDGWPIEKVVEQLRGAAERLKSKDVVV